MSETADEDFADEDVRASGIYSNFLAFFTAHAGVIHDEFTR